jgi:hypothetical protein
VTFRKTPSFIAFGDKDEILMSRIRIHPDLTTEFKIEIINLDSSKTPVARFEECKFRSIPNLQSTNLNLHQIHLKSQQKEMDGSDPQCNYKYRGKLILANNHFGFVGEQVRF